MHLDLLHSLHAAMALALIALRLALRMSAVVGATVKLTAAICCAANPSMPDTARTRSSELDLRQ